MFPMVVSISPTLAFRNISPNARIGQSRWKKEQRIVMFVKGKIQKIASLKKNYDFAKTMAVAKDGR